MPFPYQYTPSTGEKSLCNIACSYIMLPCTKAHNSTKRSGEFLQDFQPMFILVWSKAWFAGASFVNTMNYLYKTPLTNIASSYTLGSFSGPSSSIQEYVSSLAKGGSPCTHIAHVLEGGGGAWFAGGSFVNTLNYQLQPLTQTAVL